MFRQMTDQTSIHENRLNDFSPAVRREALSTLHAQVESGSLEVPERRPWFNLHCHSFYSYNAYGMSPSALVWKAKTLGLELIGLVDFDVLDGVDEFHDAGRLLGVKTVAAMETRAYIPEFSDREINSTGEPGITYHMGSGFISADITDSYRAFADRLRGGPRERNLEVVEKVNAHLDPVRVDYERDVIPLTPRGIATERHLCEAYQARAEAEFPDPAKRAEFWSERLGQDVSAKIDDSAALQGLIRSRTMKKGGVGYQRPHQDTFPNMAEVNEFVAAQGAIPMLTWLDGTSTGEQAIEELVDLQMNAGVAALNIVPDRNWNIADTRTRALKVRKLHELVQLADSRGLPIQIGTELNAPGLKFVDDLDAPELEPVRASFERGAHILFGHTVERIRSGRGYCGDWADEAFASVTEKNQYFENLGRETGRLPEPTVASS